MEIIVLILVVASFSSSQGGKGDDSSESLNKVLPNNRTISYCPVNFEEFGVHKALREANLTSFGLDNVAPIIKHGFQDNKHIYIIYYTSNTSKCYEEVPNKSFQLEITLVCKTDAQETELTPKDIAADKWIGCELKIQLFDSRVCCPMHPAVKILLYGFLAVVFMAVFGLVWKYLKLRAQRRNQAEIRVVEYRKLRKRKLLLMGKKGSGKTALKHVIFNDFAPEDTMNFRETEDVEHSRVQFLGLYDIDILDCGGHRNFHNHKCYQDKEDIFENVDIIVYVLSQELDKDMDYYQFCLRTIFEKNPNANCFCLIHKLDLIQQDQRNSIFRKREEEFKRISTAFDCICFGTSLFNPSLYRAWSDILRTLNGKEVVNIFNQLLTISRAHGVLIIDSSSFLNMNFYQNSRKLKICDQYNNISYIKQKCSEAGGDPDGKFYRASEIIVFLTKFTTYSYIMLLIEGSTIPPDDSKKKIRDAIAVSRKDFIAIGPHARIK